MNIFKSGCNIFTGVRWLKLLRDVQAEKGRVLLMLAAIAVSLAAVGSVLGAVVFQAKVAVALRLPSLTVTITVLLAAAVASTVPVMRPLLELIASPVGKPVAL